MTQEEFMRLYKTNCEGHIEKKDCGNGRQLSYLSWAWAWAEFKAVHPSATYEVVKFDGLPYLADAAVGIIVYTRVTVDDLTHEMWLPVMDASNKAMKLEAYQYTVWNNYKKQNEVKTVKAADMFDINKTIMRCLTKNLAMFGLGLSIYAGEDVPQPLTAEEESALAEDFKREQSSAQAEQPKPQAQRRTRQTKKADLPPAEPAAAPAAQPEAKKKVTKEDKDALQQIIDWTMRQADTNVAIQKIAIAYDWEQDALDYVVAQVKERFAFINDLHGNQ